MGLLAGPSYTDILEDPALSVSDVQLAFQEAFR